MNHEKLKQIVLYKVCPTCSLGMVRDTGGRIYECMNSHCRAVFDCSYVHEDEIRKLSEDGEEK